MENSPLASVIITVYNCERYLAEVIAFLLDNPEKARQMGQAGRARALDLFDWEKYVDAYDMLYRKLIRGPNDTQAAIGG